MTTETRETLLGRDVTLEDGLVVMPAGKNRRVIWVQCPTCGPQPPATAWNKPRRTLATLWHLPKGILPQGVQRLLICSVCGQDAPWKEILIPREQTRSHEACSRRCTEGKAFCACACRGRCHSEGVCYCAASTGKAT